MEHISKHFNTSFRDTKEAFKKALSSFAVENIEEQSNTLKTLVKYKTSSGKEVMSHFLVMLMPYNKGTSVYLESSYDSGSSAQFSYIFTQLISQAEKSLGEYAGFSNLEKKDFELSSSLSNLSGAKRTQPKGNENFCRLTASEFDEIVEKLITFKKLHDEKILSKEEYNEKISPLIERL